MQQDRCNEGRQFAGRRHVRRTTTCGERRTRRGGRRRAPERREPRVQPLVCQHAQRQAHGFARERAARDRMATKCLVALQAALLKACTR